MKNFIIPSLIIAYFALSYCCAVLLNGDLSSTLEMAVQVFATPMAWMIRPWMGILKQVGLAEGDWIVLPTFLGATVTGTCYAVVIFCITLLVQRFRKKPST